MTKHTALGRTLQRTAAVIAVASAAWGWPAPAQAVLAEPLADFELSAKERAALEASFERTDVNGDGKLSRDEAARLPVISAKFDELDTNKDGVLSLAEFAVGYLAVP